MRRPRRESRAQDAAGLHEFGARQVGHLAETVGREFYRVDILYKIETEKVTSEYEAPCFGVMLEHLIEQGDDVLVGDDVCRVDKT